MLLTAFKKLCSSSNNCKSLSVRLCGTAFEPKTYNPPAFVDNGIHNIRVTGKVLNIFQQSNDVIVFFIKSINSGNFKKVHKIVATNRSAAILDLAKKLKLEQNVSIEGKLSTNRIETDDGKHRSISAIIASELCIVTDLAAAIDANTDKMQPVDYNCIELLGTITTNVIGTDFKTFTLTTVRNSKYGKTDPKNLCSNRIFVYDETLFPLLNDVQIKNDTFLVRGIISYRIYTDKFGKVTTTSYIEAKQLYRV